MERANSRRQSKKPGKASPELRVVAVNCYPAPDAQHRLRRLFTMLLELTVEESPAHPVAGEDASSNECEDGDGR